jgi:hypothetical protein
MVRKAPTSSKKPPVVRPPKTKTANTNPPVTENSILGLQDIVPPSTEPPSEPPKSTNPPKARSRSASPPSPAPQRRRGRRPEPEPEEEEYSEEGEYSDEENEYSEEGEYSDEDSDNEPVSRHDFKQMMRHLVKGPGADGKPVYTEEQEIARLKLVRQIRNYFSDAELADIIKRDTHVSSSYRTLKKRSLLQLEEDLITVEEAIQNANTIEPVTMVCNFAAPIVEKAMLASDFISNKLDVSGFADEFKNDPNIKLALKMCNVQIKNMLPGGPIGALAFSAASLMYRVGVKNQSYDAVANFMVTRETPDGKYQIPAGVPIPKAFYDPEKNVDRREEYAEHIINDVTKRAKEKQALKDMINHQQSQKNKDAVRKASQPPTSKAIGLIAPAVTQGGPTNTPGSTPPVPAPRIPIVGAGSTRRRAAPSVGIIIEEHKSPPPIEDERKTPPPAPRVIPVDIIYDYDLYGVIPESTKETKGTPPTDKKVQKEIKRWETKAKNKGPPPPDSK